MNPTLAAAAWLLLSGGPPPVTIPLPTMPQPPVIECQVLASCPTHDCHRPLRSHNHITVRWVSSRIYYDRGHHRRHHHS